MSESPFRSITLGGPTPFEGKWYRADDVDAYLSDRSRCDPARDAAFVRSEITRDGAGGACGRHNMVYDGRRCPKCLAGDLSEAREHLEYAEDKAEALTGIRDGLAVALADVYAENKQLVEALGRISAIKPDSIQWVEANHERLRTAVEIAREALLERDFNREFVSECDTEGS